MLTESNKAGSKLVAASLFACAVATQFWRFRSSAFLSSYDDDFFYYLVVAKNIASRQISTFDGIHLTNGYHPLWMLVLVVFSSIARGNAIFYLVQAAIVAGVMASYWAAGNLFRKYAGDHLVTEVGAAGIAIQMLVLAQGGMEIILTIPLILAMCWYRLSPNFRWSLPTSIFYGLLASLIVLSRLDAVIFVGLLFFLECIYWRPGSIDEWLIRFGAFASGAIPIGIYLLVNWHLFHTLTPVSGQAKQLRMHHVPSVAPLLSALHSLSVRRLVVYPALVCIVLSVVVAVLRRKGRLARRDAPVVLSLMLFPLLQQIAVSSLSDWHLWSWYVYPFVVATAGALLLGFSLLPVRKRLDSGLTRRSMLAAVCAAILLFAVVDAHQSTVVRERNNNCYQFGLDLEGFARTHEGVYAMGDSAGTASYLIHQPLVQLEGLMMDEAYLDNVRKQRNVEEVLASYNVRYYVVSFPHLTDGCYQVVEPAQAGPDSMKMRGRLCMAPVAKFDAGGFPLVVFDLQAR